MPNPVWENTGQLRCICSGFAQQNQICRSMFLTGIEKMKIVSEYKWIKKGEYARQEKQRAAEAAGGMEPSKKPDDSSAILSPARKNRQNGLHIPILTI